jgi:hypothetical protein
LTDARVIEKSWADPEQFAAILIATSARSTATWPAGSVASWPTISRPTCSPPPSPSADDLIAVTMVDGLPAGSVLSYDEDISSGWANQAPHRPTR